MITLTAISTFLLLPGCQGVQDARRGDEIAWPRESKADGYTVVTYQPQIDEWKGDYSKLVARAAVSVKPPKSEDAVFGSIKMAAKTPPRPRPTSSPAWCCSTSGSSSRSGSRTPTRPWG
jgi:hypothetical protein